MLPPICHRATPWRQIERAAHLLPTCYLPAPDRPCTWWDFGRVSVRSCPVSKRPETPSNRSTIGLSSVYPHRLCNHRRGVSRGRPSTEHRVPSWCPFRTPPVIPSDGLTRPQAGRQWGHAGRDIRAGFPRVRVSPFAAVRQLPRCREPSGQRADFHSPRASGPSRASGRSMDAGRSTDAARVRAREARPSAAVATPF